MDTLDRLADPRPLPRALADPAPVVIAAQVLWALAWVVLTVGDHGPDLWRTVCACGFLLGFAGLAVIWWQRRGGNRNR